MPVIILCLIVTCTVSVNLFVAYFSYLQFHKTFEVQQRITNGINRGLYILENDKKYLQMHCTSGLHITKVTIWIMDFGM